MRIRPPIALFFDLDQTLLCSPGFQEANAKTCRLIAEKCYGLSPDLLLDANDKFWKEYVGRFDDWILGKVSGSSMNIDAWRRTLNECGSSDDSLVLFASSTNLSFIRNSYEVFDDVPELVKEIDRRGLPTALVTNGASDTQREKISSVGMEAWFDALAISADYGIAKPDPSAFQPALEYLGIQGDSVWHVGDSLETDVAGANAAGLTSIWLNRNGALRGPNDPVPEVEIRSLSDLFGILEQ